MLKSFLMLPMRVCSFLMKSDLEYVLTSGKDTEPLSALIRYGNIDEARRAIVEEVLLIINWKRRTEN